MFTQWIGKSFRGSRMLAAAVVAAGLVGGPSVAQARPHLSINLLLPPFLRPPAVVVHTCPPPPVVVVEQPQQVWVEPVYQTVSDRQWVAPAVQTVTSHVWVPPATQAVASQVYVPDQYGYRQVATYGPYGRTYYSRQYVLIAPAHYETRTDVATVVPGHYEDVAQQQVICEGHWANVDRQVEVTPGHFETRLAPVAACPVVVPAVGVRLPF